MEDRLEHLFQEWYHLGGAVLLAEVDTSLPIRSPEKVVAESTAYCRESGRLTWVVLDWLIHHIEEIDEHELLRETMDVGNLSVLGVLCDAAHLCKLHSKFERIMAVCPPNNELEPFFSSSGTEPLGNATDREACSRSVS